MTQGRLSARHARWKAWRYLKLKKQTTLMHGEQTSSKEGRAQTHTPELHRYHCSQATYHARSCGLRLSGCWADHTELRIHQCLTIQLRLPRISNSHSLIPLAGNLKPLCTGREFCKLTNSGRGEDATFRLPIEITTM